MNKPGYAILWKVVPGVLLILTMCVLYTIYPSAVNNTIKGATFARSEYDCKCVPDRFEDQLDVVKLCSWGNEPKESWQGHYQHIFQKYNISSSRKSYGHLKCNVTFKPTMMENMDVVSKYHFNIHDAYLQRFSLDKFGINILAKPLANPRKYPVFVTAASSNHYMESQGLIQTYHKLLKIHPELKMIYYDFGLKPEERKELEKYCMCDVRTFEVDKYPKHISEIKTYAWKPIIIQTVLQEYDLVMWVDASIRFNGKPLDFSSLLARQRGLQIMADGGSVAQRTTKISFEFLGEPPCLYNFPEIATGWIVISRNRFTLEYIMRPWILCALSYNCMVYDNSLKNLDCQGKSLYHDCHRYEQSVLGILLCRLFNQQRNIVLYDARSIMTVRRSHQVRYFDTLKESS